MLWAGGGECYIIHETTLSTPVGSAVLALPAMAAVDGDKEAHGAMRWLTGAFRGREEVVVLPATAPAALRRQVRRACQEYASALGAKLPPLVVELVQGNGRRPGKGGIERVEGERGVLYRVSLPVGDGTAAEAALREALVRVLTTAGALRLVPLDGAATARAQREQGHAGEADVLRGRVQKAASPVWLRWRARGKATPLVMASPVEGQGLPLLRDALSRRGMELLAAVPYPAREEEARPLDGLGGIALRQPVGLAMCLRRLAGAAAGAGAYVAVPAPPGCSEADLFAVGQALTGVRLAAGVVAASGRVYLRLPAGIEALAPYLEGRWLERAVAGWIGRLLAGRGLAGVEVATQARVRLERGQEGEVDVLAVAGGRLVAAECSVGAWSLLKGAGHRRRLWSGRRLPGDVCLVACVLGGEEELLRLRQAYGWPAWRLAEGLEALGHIIGSTMEER